MADKINLILIIKTLEPFYYIFVIDLNKITYYITLIHF